MPAMDQAVLEEILAWRRRADYNEPRYMELLLPHHYGQHVLRMPADAVAGPGGRAAFTHINQKIYVPMQGPASWARAASSSTGTAWPTCRASRCRRS